jgi:hypothetical protein
MKRKLRLADGFSSIRFAKEVEQILREAVADALRMHKLHNNPIAVWDGEKVVIIAPEEIEVPEYKRTGAQGSTQHPRRRSRQAGSKESKQ